MRILHCISSLEIGGAEGQLRMMAAAQAERHEVHVAFVRGGPHLAPLVQAGVHPILIQVKSNRDPRLPLLLRRLCRELDPDLIQSWLTQMDVAAGLAARSSNVPWILSERSSIAAYSRNWKQALRRHLARGADLIVANSAGGAAYWAGIAPRTPRRVISNALPLNRIRSAPMATLPPRTVVFVGRLAPEKRVEVLIRAMAGPLVPSDAHLVLCGDGTERPALEALARQLSLTDRVEFLGRRDDPWSYIRGASVVVNPSAFEGRPNAVLEAMASCRPIVASDIAAHRELLDERAAWLVNVDDVGQLAAAIRAALDDPIEAGARGAEAAARTVPFDLPRIVEQYDDAYNAVLDARRAGRRR